MSERRVVQSLPTFGRPHSGHHLLCADAAHGTAEGCGRHPAVSRLPARAGDHPAGGGPARYVEGPAAPPHAHPARPGVAAKCDLGEALPTLRTSGLLVFILIGLLCKTLLSRYSEGRAL